MGGGAPEGDGPGLGPFPASAFWASRFSDATADVAACTRKRAQSGCPATYDGPARDEGRRHRAGNDRGRLFAGARAARAGRCRACRGIRPPALPLGRGRGRGRARPARPLRTRARRTSTSPASVRPARPRCACTTRASRRDGWQSTHTAVEIVTDDMPFLIDSVSMELNRRGFGVHLIIHPVLGVRRDDDGELIEILPQPPQREPEEGVARSRSSTPRWRGRPTRRSCASSSCTLSALSAR